MPSAALDDTAALSRNAIHERRTIQPERDLSREYFQREFSGQADEWKQPQRERVLDFILSHHRPRQPMRFFGFPAAMWTFEKMIQDRRPDAKFIGVERSWQVLEYGVRHMPGERTEFEKVEIKTGAIDTFKSSQSRIAHFHAEHFWEMSRFFIGSRAARRQFVQTFFGWTAAWIDPFTSITGRFRESLHRVPARFVENYGNFPLVVSFSIGREYEFESNGSDPFMNRVELVRSELSKNQFRDFVVVDAFTSGREGGVQMGTVCGVVVPRK